MLLQRYRATSDFIRNLQLQEDVDKDMTIQDHLTRKVLYHAEYLDSSFLFKLTNCCFFSFVFFLCKALHRRCIEQLYDEHGLDMLDALSQKTDTRIALVILESRLNQKIEDLEQAQLSLNKACSNIIANNYYRSLDHRSSSFKQLDKRRMRPKGIVDNSSTRYM
jgi:paired amphipathic helix protein Sin3a